MEDSTRVAALASLVVWLNLRNGFKRLVGYDLF